MAASNSSNVWIAKMFLLCSLFGLSLVQAYPSGSTHCASGGLKKDRGGGGCSCVGTVYYCAGTSNSCYSRTIGGYTTCSNNVFGDPQYKARKNCYCKPSGCTAGNHGPAGSCTACGVGKYQGQNAFTGSACGDCPSGQYQNQNGQTGCKVSMSSRCFVKSILSFFIILIYIF